MFRFLLASLFILSVDQSIAQNYKASFDRLFQKEDTAGQLQLLRNWEKATPADAELFIAWFNYYFFAGRREALLLSDDAGMASSAELAVNGGPNTAGILSETYEYDTASLAKAFRYIDTGIGVCPQRLDMRFGKIYALGELKQYEAFTNEIINTLNVSDQLQRRWLWTGNKRVKDLEQVMLSAIQDYVVRLYNEGDEQLIRMRRIAETVLKYYPRHVESLSNLAITYGLQGQYDEALDALLRAEKIMPHDVIVLNNIATMYERKGDTSNAIHYFELTARHGDKNARHAAAKKLEELKK